MKQIYYDAFRTGLIPVSEPRKVPADEMPFGATMYYVRVQKSIGAYVKHEVLKVHASSLVHKARVTSSGQQLVVQWQPEERAA